MSPVMTMTTMGAPMGAIDGFVTSSNAPARIFLPPCTPKNLWNFPIFCKGGRRPDEKCRGAGCLTPAPRQYPCTPLHLFIILEGEGRSDECFSLDASCVFAGTPSTGEQTSPAIVVFVTFAKVFGDVVLPVPEPSRIPAQASLMVLLVTVLPLPVDGGHSIIHVHPDWALP